MDNPGTQKTLDTRHRMKTSKKKTTFKSKKTTNTDPTRKLLVCTRGIVKGKKLLVCTRGIVKGKNLLVCTREIVKGKQLLVCTRGIVKGKQFLCFKRHTSCLLKYSSSVKVLAMAEERNNPSVQGK
jgi:hypothetical protein